MKSLAEIKVDNAPPPTPKPKRAKPVKAELTYKVICISIYNKDLEHLDRKVDELKARGYHKASRSLVIRLAMSEFDPKAIEIPEVQ